MRDPAEGKTFRYPSEGDLFCGCCLRFTTALKTDKRGRPYLWCASCRSRTFVGSDAGLTAIRTMSPERLERVVAAVRGSTGGYVASAGADAGEGAEVAG
jgi:hypothetical protein